MTIDEIRIRLLRQITAWRRMHAANDAAKAAYEDCAFSLEAIVKYDLATNEKEGSDESRG
jgi:hypothetical protein